MTSVNLANQLSSSTAAGQHSEHSRRNPDAVRVRRGPAKGPGGNNYRPKKKKKLQSQKQCEFFPPFFQAVQEKNQAVHEPQLLGEPYCMCRLQLSAHSSKQRHAWSERQQKLGARKDFAKSQLQSSLKKKKKKLLSGLSQGNFF